MDTTIPAIGVGRLERLCRPAADRIRFGAGAAGIERLEARFVGQAFAPHRHDTYAIGITVTGVQVFRYRGEQRCCLPGQCHILHPDELHDGGAGTEAAFSYRIAYLDPSLVHEALDGRPLPFVRQPVVEAACLPDRFTHDVWSIDQEIDDVARIELVALVADLLAGLAGDAVNRSKSLAFAALSRVRDAIAADPAGRCGMAELERLSGLDRWTLARQFRAAFGTSPSRFRTMRQLDRVRRLLADGWSLAEASVEAGFADQSHMSRRFKGAYGRTPARWIAAAFPSGSRAP